MGCVTANVLKKASNVFPSWTGGNDKVVLSCSVFYIADYSCDNPEWSHSCHEKSGQPIDK